ncbi:MAG: 1-deoxy-D-xylulose-5-phosphate synthase [Eubacteriales bacterium]|nr:1-deoxy-D-xylulose-5-phosphate synthase [Eubacteriales bacterium]MDD3883216.1 1-deoxy-D-xylulose-5-phosphate synthase [Eubacteriales bacterium]MDD4512708.1 1-deoxy-D-xylulose-5-phosphate synthase [Eubacteriales bacterium]
MSRISDKQNRIRLSDVRSPKDIKGLSGDGLNALADEIRHTLIHTVSESGGHLASNLGIVELTLALHSVYSCPKDKIIFDVGHQSYVHKLLTGRYNEFPTLRMEGGLSGFPKRSESEYDAFNTGHAATSISAALGMAHARDINGTDEHIVAVIGDGALNGGLSYEALGDLGHNKTNMLIILNDNEMAIDRNVGALSGHLSELRSSYRYLHIKENVKRNISRLPVFGRSLYSLLEHGKDALARLFVHDRFFSSLGLNYFGPIDGHDTEQLIRYLTRIRHISGPVILHVITQKGRGYLPAEKSPEHFHGVTPFDEKSGAPVNAEIARKNSKTVGETLCMLAQEDSSVVAITAAMSDGTGLNDFARRFPERFFDVGIAEEHAATMAAGMAASGLKPYFVVYNTFAQRAYDEILHDACLQNLPVRILLDRSGFVGEDGETHHGLYDFAYLRHMPNMRVFAPADERELQHMILLSRYADYPLAIRYPRDASVMPPYVTSDLPLGKWERLRPGRDGTLLAVGSMVSTAIMIRDKLIKEGLELSVVNGSSVCPLDNEMLCEIAAQGAPYFTLEEHSLPCGFGSAVLEECHKRAIAMPLKCFGLEKEIYTQGTITQLKRAAGLDEETLETEIAAAIRRKKELDDERTN